MNALRIWRATWNPDMFHGWGKTSNFFEGWYFKIVSPDERHALAVIPGISMPKNGEAQAFVQVLDGKKCTSDFFKFKVAEFQPSDQKFELRLGSNFFSGESIRLDLPNVSGEIAFEKTTPWPKMLGAPGIMGWYSFVPFMECFHGVLSLDHVLSGTLKTGGQTVDFSGGRGYAEKDWGRSFPRAYVWMQSNHFQAVAPVSVMASVAHIPWLGSHFIGFIGGFFFDGKLHRFATYTGAKKHLELGRDSVSLIFKNPKNELRVLAKKGEGGTLFAPISGEMVGKINESMQATLQVEFLENGRRVFEGVGRNAGLEVAGATEVLLEN